MTRPVSGDRYEIAADGYRAEIASVGATLRILQRDGRDLVAPFPADRIRPAMSGALLVPWPNRLADGSFAFDGVRHRLPLDEADTGTAVHGLVAWQDFTARSVRPDRLTLSVHTVPRPGYPWRLLVETVFRVDERGLSQEVTVRNESSRSAPLGIGAHPYLLAARGRDSGIDDWLLELGAERVLLASADRMLPTEEIPVSALPRFDFRARRRIGATAINNAYTSLARGSDGLFRAQVTDEDGFGAAISWDDRMPWAQVYTADAGEGGAHRHAVAIEPMTCPPDAFNTGRDLLVLAPGDRASVGWTISAVSA